MVIDFVRPRADAGPAEAFPVVAGEISNEFNAGITPFGADKPGMTSCCVAKCFDST